jgi:ribulose-bisphosphate carboxylase large chain
MDQSARYADLSLDEDELLKAGGHILVAYTMTPMPGFGGYRLHKRSRLYGLRD